MPMVEELEAIAEMLKQAEQYGLTCEVIASAMDYLKAYPNESIEQACAVGLWEWMCKMTWLDLAGAAAALLTTIEVIPQVIRSFVTKSTKDLSYSALWILVIGLTLWLVYGIGKMDLWIIVSAGFTGALYLILLLMKLVYDRRVK